MGSIHTAGHSAAKRNTLQRGWARKTGRVTAASLKGCVLCDAVYTKGPGQANRRQNIEQGRQGLRGAGGLLPGRTNTLRNWVVAMAA